MTLASYHLRELVVSVDGDRGREQLHSRHTSHGSLQGLHVSTTLSCGREKAYAELGETTLSGFLIDCRALAPKVSCLAQDAVKCLPRVQRAGPVVLILDRLPVKHQFLLTIQEGICFAAHVHFS